VLGDNEFETLRDELALHQIQLNKAAPDEHASFKLWLSKNCCTDVLRPMNKPLVASYNTSAHIWRA
jgi:hypothetical protein